MDMRHRRRGDATAVGTCNSAGRLFHRRRSIGAVEGARAKERQGAYLTRQDRENLRRYGSSDDYGRRYSYGPYGYGDGYDVDDDYDDGPAVSISIGD